jgi:hypothetical protein
MKQPVLARQGQGSARPGPAPGDAGGAGPSTTDDDIAIVVARRVAAIAPDDPKRERKALRVFLESMLLAELGGELIHDAAFFDMVDHVQAQMEADPELSRAMREASRILLPK